MSLRWVPRFYLLGYRLGFILFWTETESSLLFIYIGNTYKTVCFIYIHNSFFLLELVRREVNIIPKCNSWLVESGNIRLIKYTAKMWSRASRCSIDHMWTQTRFLMSFHYVTCDFVAPYSVVWSMCEIGLRKQVIYWKCMMKIHNKLLLAQILLGQVLFFWSAPMLILQLNWTLQ